MVVLGGKVFRQGVGFVPTASTVDSEERSVVERVLHLEREVRELREAMSRVPKTGIAAPEPCQCNMAKWQRSQGLPIDCGHERTPGQGPTVRQRRVAELAQIDAEEDAKNDLINAGWRPPEP